MIKTIILAGGLGTRLAEETSIKPKPMIEIGGKPMLWHIMKLYSFYGFNNFALACGYKIDIIKLYFSNIHLFNNDYIFNTKDGTKQQVSNNYNNTNSNYIICIKKDEGMKGRPLRPPNYV